MKFILAFTFLSFCFFIVNGVKFNVPPQFSLKGTSYINRQFYNRFMSLDQNAFRAYQEFEKTNLWNYCVNNQGLGTWPVEVMFQLGIKYCTIKYYAPSFDNTFSWSCNSYEKLNVRRNSCAELYQNSPTLMANYPLKFLGISCLDVENYNQTGNSLSATTGDCEYCECNSIKITVNTQGPYMLPTVYLDLKKQRNHGFCQPYFRNSTFANLDFNPPSWSKIDQKLQKICNIDPSKPFSLPPIPQQSIIAFGVENNWGSVWSVNAINGASQCLFKPTASIPSYPSHAVRTSSGKIFYYGGGPCCATNYGVYGWIDHQKGTLSSYSVSPSFGTLWSVGVNNFDGKAYGIGKPIDVHWRINLLELDPTNPNNASVAFTFEDIYSLNPGYQGQPSVFWKQDGKTLYILGTSSLLVIDHPQANQWNINRVIKTREFITNGVLDAEKNILYGVVNSMYHVCTLASINLDTGLTTEGHGRFIQNDCDFTSCDLGKTNNGQVLTCYQGSRASYIHIDLNTYIVLQSPVTNQTRPFDSADARLFVYADKNSVNPGRC